MSCCISPPSASTSMDTSWWAPHRGAFLNALAAQGYAERTLDTFRLMTGRLCAELDARGLAAEEVDAGMLADLAAACPRTGSPSMERDLISVTRRFADYLVDSDAIAPMPAPPPPASGSLEQLSAQFDAWLRQHRGMFGGRLREHRTLLKRFMTFCRTGTRKPDDPGAVTPESIFAFVDRFPGKSNWRLPYLRNILRFLFWSGRLPRDLTDAVPRSARSRPDGLPRHLEPDTVRTLIEAARGDSPRERRDHAMLLMMARLGLRGQEAIAVRLDDIDWRAGRMLIHGKGGQSDRMPLPVDVGETIVAWVRNGRKGSSRHLFVSVRPPYRPFTSSLTIRRAFRQAYERAGLTPPRGQARTHALRHSLAMDLLGRGASLEEIGDVLRHRSHQSTTVYARYDIEALRPLARSWPVPGAMR